jgi:hypothetical protein
VYTSIIHHLLWQWFRQWQQQQWGLGIRKARTGAQDTDVSRAPGTFLCVSLLLYLYLLTTSVCSHPSTQQPWQLQRKTGPNCDNYNAKQAQTMLMVISALGILLESWLPHHTHMQYRRWETTRRAGAWDMSWVPGTFLCFSLLFMWIMSLLHMYKLK